MPGMTTVGITESDELVDGDGYESDDQPTKDENQDNSRPKGPSQTS